MKSSLPTYSVAIRTLGKAGKLYQNLLDSLLVQSHKPEKIVIYIADGYPIPAETIGIEQYVYVSKGMVAQRALLYKEIESEYILMLDDDAVLAPDSVEKLFSGLLSDPRAKCIAVNSFANHQWTWREKLKYALFGTTPRKSDGYAFRVKNNICYSYNINPEGYVLRTESFAGVAFLIHADTFRSINFADERWMDEFGYAIGDDLLLAQKLLFNGHTSLVHYNSGVVHQDAQTGHLRTNFADKLEHNTCLLYVVWHRIRSSANSNSIPFLIYVDYWISVIWKSLLYVLISIYMMNFKVILGYWTGLCRGVVYTRSPKYKSLKPFIVTGKKQ